MSDSQVVLTPWLVHIKAQLQELPGNSDQKIRAMMAAIKLDEALPASNPGLEKWGRILRRMFEHWVGEKHYLNPPLSPDYTLPDSVHHSDAEVAIAYDLRTDKGVQAKQIQLANAAEVRIETALIHLRGGWDLCDARCFICSKEEYRQVQRRSGVCEQEPSIGELAVVT